MDAVPGRLLDHRVLERPPPGRRDARRSDSRRDRAAPAARPRRAPATVVRRHESPASAETPGSLARHVALTIAGKQHLVSDASNQVTALAFKTTASAAQPIATSQAEPGSGW